jgi:calmodulin
LLNEKNLNMAFQMFDTDHNGTISREELKTIFETSEKKEEELWTEIFLEVDINNDGEISFEEFK